MTIRIYTTLLFLLLSIVQLTAQEIQVFNLFLYQSNTHGNKNFISLSELLPYSEHADSLVIPDLSEMEESQAAEYEYIKPEGNYRTNFMSLSHISETDNIYIYDYSKNILVTLRVKDVHLLACLNIYGAEWPYSQYDYMIGFEINGNVLTNFDKYFIQSYVCIGKENPFAQVPLKHIVWKEIEATAFPLLPIDDEDTLKFKRYTSNPCNYYYYASDGMEYFIQEFKSEYGIGARRLLVLNSKTKELVCQRIYYDHESASPAPLTEQWVGKLFKNVPPVIFGFEYISFGCPHLIVLDSTGRNIYLNCDNRH